MFLSKRTTRLVILFVVCFFATVARSAEDLPSRLSDDAYWKLITDLSEPGGKFLSENFVSNELRIQAILGELTEGRKSAGAYIGVGPEQNFTYIAALKPKIAFIIDIRRQNMIEHLLYKALIELSSDRAEFLSKLFSRPKPSNLGKDSTVTALFRAYQEVDPDSAMFDDTILAVKDHLTKTHGFNLSSEDLTNLQYVLAAFYTGGPNLGYPGPSQANRPEVARILPTYEELMIDRDEDGHQRSYLANEETFQTLRQFEKDNLIVPLVGDFAGPKAIRAIGTYLKDHSTVVSAFYTSNVEQYLFMTADDWKNFYTNVSKLPLDSKSVFIRPLINTSLGYSSSPQFRAGFHWDTLLFSIRPLIAAFEAGKVENYYDAIQRRD